MRWFPSPPPVVTSGPVKLRYEDVTQDGHLILHSMATAFGQIGWPAVMKQYPRPNDGTVPILTRLVLEGGDAPISVHPPLTCDTTHGLAHVLDEAGEVDRLYMHMWVSLTGVVGNTHGFEVPDAGKPLSLGRGFAEHVFTRPFAPPEDRKVRKLSNVPGPHPPGNVYIARTGAEVIASPDGFTSLDEMSVDESPLVFGLSHTDSNQHVNSLVYPRYFEDAALRRLAKHGVSGTLLGRYVEVLFRKPFFAGAAPRWTLRAFKKDDEYCVVGTLSDSDRPNTYCRLFLR